MTTWIVTDSRGKHHEVMAEKMEIIGKNIVLRNAGSPFSENVAVFHEPVAIMPKPDSDSCGDGILIPPLAFLQKMLRKFA